MTEEKCIDLPVDRVNGILDQISHNKIFKDCDQKKLREIVLNSRLTTLIPYEKVWDFENESQIEFSLILKGCVAVIYNSDVRPTINALLVPNQFYGEFELLDPNSQSQRLQTLFHSVILVPDREDIEKLRKTQAGKFYEGLAKTLVQKLKIQNHVINFRSRGRVNERLAYFLYRLNHKELKQVTERDSATENSYDVSIYFSTTIFEAFMYSEHKTICTNLAKLVDQNVIEVTRFYNDFAEDKKLNSDDLTQLAAVPRNQVNEDNYVKIKVLDFKNMKSKNGLKKFN